MRLRGCGHRFHQNCINEWCQQRHKCPLCNAAIGTVFGNGPATGTMSWRLIHTRLGGFTRADTDKAIEINFSFPPGVHANGQQHQNQRYDARSETAYLPFNEMGVTLWRLYQIAFTRKSMFGIGWRHMGGGYAPIFQIHIRTSTSPGEHGWP